MHTRCAFQTNIKVFIMEKVFSRSVPEKATTLEQELVKEKKRELWLMGNRETISSYNSHVEKNGAFSDGLRDF